MTATADKMARNNILQNFNPSDFAYDGTPINLIQVQQISPDLARGIIAAFHYSKTFPDSTILCYGAYLNGKLVGVVCYGMGGCKEQYTSLFPNIKNGTYLELTRLWVAYQMPRNSESKIISMSLKLLPPQYKVILSFADEGQGHCGIIYQATNWVYLGCNNGNSIYIDENGVSKHTHLITIYRQRHPELKDLPREEILNILGFKRATSGKKHRYLFLRGSKKDKKALLSLVKDKIQPYPKIDKKNGLTEEQIVESEQPTFTQIKLF